MGVRLHDIATNLNDFVSAEGASDRIALFSLIEAVVSVHASGLLLILTTFDRRDSAASYSAHT